jgi:SH3-like domain-containing protein
MAVIQFPSVGILSAPDATGVEVFQLHEGTLVEIKGKQGNWQKIRLADGKEGWMSKEAARGF